MGYDIVRCKENGEPHEIKEVHDPNYFRWNIFGMERVRDLAAWGVGALTNQDIGNTMNDSGGQPNSMEEMLRQIAGSFRPKSYTKELHWGSAFVHNGETVSAKDCLSFVAALEAAQKKIFSSPVLPDWPAMDWDYLESFIDYLECSPHGVYVG